MGRQGGLDFQKQPSRRIDKGPLPAHMHQVQSYQMSYGKTCTRDLGATGATQNCSAGTFNL